MIVIFVVIVVGLGVYALWTFCKMKKLPNKSSIEMTDFN